LTPVKGAAGDPDDSTAEEPADEEDDDEEAEIPEQISLNKELKSDDTVADDLGDSVPYDSDELEVFNQLDNKAPKSIL